MKYKIEVSREVTAQLIVEVPDGTDKHALYNLLRNPEFMKLATEVDFDGDPSELKLDYIAPAHDTEVEEYGVDLVLITPLK